MAGFRFQPQVEDAIARASARYGVPLDAMRAQAQIESSGNPNEQNPKSSAGGLYQFIDKTAKQYGLTNKYDPYQSSDAAARLMRDNYNGLSSALGRAPTTGELYLAHQQGLGGATNLLSNPNAPATSIVGSKAVALNGGGNNMTAGQFANIWVNKANALAGQASVPDGVAAPISSAPIAPAVDMSGVASLAPSAAGALPTVQEAAPAADPMSGIFSLLAQAQTQKAAPVAAPMPVVRKAPDMRSDDEKLAAVSQTPNVYFDRLRRRQTNG